MSIPIGTIVIWTQAASLIPDGWVICDGTNGTPAMSGSSVKGAPYVTGNTNLGVTSSSVEHNHTFSSTTTGAAGADHTHTLGVSISNASPRTDNALYAGSPGWWVSRSGHGHTGVSNQITANATASHSHTISGGITSYSTATAPTVKLHYIMKIAEA